MSTTYEQERTQEQREVDERILERVKRGIAWLEENYGPSWVDKIDLSTLNLMLPDRCVLGQVYGDEAHDYSGLKGAEYNGYGYARVTKSIEDAGWLGFSITPGQWGKLQETWEYVLTPIVEKK